LCDTRHPPAAHAFAEPGTLSACERRPPIYRNEKLSSVVDVSHCYRRHSQEQHQDSADGRLLPPKAAAEIKEETFSEECMNISLG